MRKVEIRGQEAESKIDSYLYDNPKTLNRNLLERKKLFILVYRIKRGGA